MNSPDSATIAGGRGRRSPLPALAILRSLLTAILVPIAVPAQTILADLRPKDGLAPLAPGDRAAPTFGDLDGDGRVDLIVGDGTALVVCEGLGGERFLVRTAMPLFTLKVSITAMADFDGDGDLDLYASDRQQIRLLRNDGNFQFVNVTTSLMSISMTYPADLLPADLDGDGDVDLLGPTPVLNIPNVLWLNDGTGRLTDVVATHMPPGIVPTDGAGLADLDGDGDLDIALATRQGVRVFVNDGTARFTDESAARLPANTPVRHLLRVADVDRDGDIDVMVGGSALGLFRNDGRGHFSDASASLPAIAPISGMSFGDLDNDGAPELLTISSATWTDLPLQVLANDGTGGFVDATNAVLANRVTSSLRSVVAFDVDRDGWRDFAVFGVLCDALFLNDRQGRVSDVWQPRVPRSVQRGSAPTYVHLFAADRDGDQDLVTGSYVLRNDGSGSFVAGPRTAGFLTPSPITVATGDVDGDGDADMISAPTSLYLNDGNGNFTNADAQLLRAGSGRFVDLGDLDGDGDLDLALSGSSGLTGLEFWRNDGGGRFLSIIPAPTTGSFVSDARFLDIDLDGDLDVVGVRNESGVRQLVYVNQGNGQLVDESATRGAVVTGFPRRLAVGDLDRDGDVDLVVRCDSPAPPAVMLNDGRGHYSIAPAGYLSFLNEAVTALELFDFDGDGDLDVATNRMPASAPRLYENQGTQFALSTTALPASWAAWELASGDIDDDGDVDLIGSTVLTNCRRQIQVSRIPYSGGRLEVTLYARDPLTLGNHTGLVLLAASRLPAPINTPWGRLAIDPALSVALPGFALPAPDRSAVQVLSIPVNPGLFGSFVHLQGVAFADSDPFGTLRLCNALSEMLR